MSKKLVNEKRITLEVDLSLQVSPRSSVALLGNPLPLGSVGPCMRRKLLGGNRKGESRAHDSSMRGHVIG